MKDDDNNQEGDLLTQLLDEIEQQKTPLQNDDDLQRLLDELDERTITSTPTQDEEKDHD